MPRPLLLLTVFLSVDGFEPLQSSDVQSQCDELSDDCLDGFTSLLQDSLYFHQVQVSPQKPAGIHRRNAVNMDFHGTTAQQATISYPMMMQLHDPPTTGLSEVLRKDDPAKLGALETIGPFFLILGVIWWFYFMKKDMFPEKSPAYMALVGFSFSVTSVSMHTLNKVSVSFTHAPSSLTVVQMMIALVSFMAVYHREVLQADRAQMMKWCFVPLVYAAMLNTSLLGYQYLSLTLVTLLRTCAPLLTMCIEQFIMPPEHRPKFTLPVVAALAAMITGAFLFSYTMESFSFVGLCIIILNTLLAIFDRVLQRRLLVEECKDLPLSACMVLNNSLGMFPSFAVAWATNEFGVIREHTANWTDPGIITLMIMSGFMGLGIGIFGLMCQKAMSATSFQVLQNSSKVVVVTIGMKLFGDKIDSPARVVGLVLSIGGSLAYGYAKSLEMAPAKKSGELEPLRGDAAHKA